MKKGESGICFFLPRVVSVAGHLTSSLELLSFQKQALKLNLTHLNFFFSRKHGYTLCPFLWHIHSLSLWLEHTSVVVSAECEISNIHYSTLFFQWVHVLSTPLTHTQLKPLSRAYKRRCVSGIRNRRYPLKSTNHTNIFYQNYVSFEFPIAPGNT